MFLLIPIIAVSSIKKQEQNLHMIHVIIMCSMDFEERERRERRHMIKVVIAEAGMVFAVVAIVAVATLASMGFFVSSNGSIEQSGLAQIHSIPTGASVELDGSTLFSRTNLSRTIPEGEHHLKMTRANYDSWENTIKMRPPALLPPAPHLPWAAPWKESEVPLLSAQSSHYPPDILP